jgi:hypothetical protein
MFVCCMLYYGILDDNLADYQKQAVKNWSVWENR